VEARLADLFGLTPEEREQVLPSGRQKVLHNRIHWAKFYLGKAGLVDSPRRGVFVASAEGRRVLAANPERITNQMLLDYDSFRGFYRNGSTDAQDASTASGTTPAGDGAGTPEETIEAAHEALQSALRGDLVTRIHQNSPSFFERVIVDLLVAMGYGGTHRDAARQLGRSGDGGVDGVINEDPLGLDRVYIQAKRYAPGNAVGRPEVQGFVGSLVGLGATKGVFVTTSTYSAQAREFVRHLTQRVILIDGPHLASLMIEHGVGVRTHQTLEFKRLDEDFFTEED
jgi:restriction system protein